MTSPDTADRFVLDAFALLALFQNEPGADRVTEVLERGRTGASVAVAAVNFAEVLYRLERKHGEHGASNAQAVVIASGIDIVPCDAALGIRAARHKARNPISLADCFAVALAEQTRATVVTGDADFQRFESVVSVEWLPGRA